MTHITITIDEHNSFNVLTQHGYVDRLTWDEMLGHVAQLTHPSIREPRFSEKKFSKSFYESYERSPLD